MQLHQIDYRVSEAKNFTSLSGSLASAYKFLKLKNEYIRFDDV
jgi:hypothetical protein